MTAAVGRPPGPRRPWSLEERNRRVGTAATRLSRSPAPAPLPTPAPCGGALSAHTRCKDSHRTRDRERRRSLADLGDDERLSDGRWQRRWSRALRSPYG